MITLFFILYISLLAGGIYYMLKLLKKIKKYNVRWTLTLVSLFLSIGLFIKIIIEAITFIKTL